MRVLVIDDSAFMRKMIKEMVNSHDSFEVIGTARDGVDGVQQAIELQPDLITMDIEMPNKNGLDALREILARNRTNPPAVLMCSTLTVDGSVEALKALKIGAADFIAKDPQVVGQNDPAFRQELISKLTAIGEHRSQVQSTDTTKKPLTINVGPESDSSGTRSTSDDWEVPQNIEAIVVGSSTGGPPVLEKIFSKLPATLPVPIIVAQHMPELFTKSLASRLDNHCACEAKLASHGTDMTKPGIYIAQGGHHIKPVRIAGNKVVARTIEQIDGALYKPSVDVLFSQAAQLYGSRVLAIQLTGMGEDGAVGAKEIRNAGGHVIAQDDRSCVVFGMPRAVIENGSASAIMTPIDIQKVLLSICQTSNSGGQPERISA